MCRALQPVCGVNNLCVEMANKDALKSEFNL